MVEEQGPANVSSPSEGSSTNHVAETRDTAAWRNSNTSVESPAGGEEGIGDSQKCCPPATGYLMGTSAEQVSPQKAKGIKKRCHALRYRCSAQTNIPMSPKTSRIDMQIIISIQGMTS